MKKRLFGAGIISLLSIALVGTGNSEWLSNANIYSGNAGTGNVSLPNSGKKIIAYIQNGNQKANYTDIGKALADAENGRGGIPYIWSLLFHTMTKMMRVG